MNIIYVNEVKILTVKILSQNIFENIKCENIILFFFGDINLHKYYPG